MDKMVIDRAIKLLIDDEVIHKVSYTYACQLLSLPEDEDLAELFKSDEQLEDEFYKLVNEFNTSLLVHCLNEFTKLNDK